MTAVEAEGTREPGHAPDDVELIERETVYTGFFSMVRYGLRHRKYDGAWSRPMEREIFERGHAVAVVLYDPDKDRLVLIEQFRPGAWVAGQEPHLEHAFTPWLIEVVAGIIEDGEAPDAVARREAVEEAGCVVREMRSIGPILTTPGGSSETVALFLGTVDAPETGGVFGLDEEHEDIRVLVASPDQVWDWMDRGRIVNGPALVGLMWFRIHQAELRPVPTAGTAPVQR